MGAERVNELFYEKLEAAESPDHPWVSKRVKHLHDNRHLLLRLLKTALGYVEHYRTCGWPEKECNCGLSAWLQEADELLS